MEKVRSEKIRDKKDQTERKGRKVAKHRSNVLWLRRGKSRLAKAASAEAAAQMRDEKVHVIVARSTKVGALLEVGM